MPSTRVAVVTGGNKGIGFCIVKFLCQQFDGDVILTARDEKRGNAAVSEFNKQLLRPKFHQLDIDDLESIRKFWDFLKGTYGGLDVLVNNAAISYKAAISNFLVVEMSYCIHMCTWLKIRTWCRCKAFIDMSLHLCTSFILLVLTHRSETWRLTKRVQLKLRTTQRAMERKMIGVTLKDRKRAEWVREQTRVNDIL
ncbi:D-beta-hydroxybutyrate dehydrogenase-like isoform X1 [Amblyomma americanum]